MNAIMTIKPYRHNGGWAFTDAAAGLTHEPFVAGIPEMIDRLIREIGSPDEFAMLFSSSPFPGRQIKLDWLLGEYGGNWYRCHEYEMDGWLCPALFAYFQSAPKEIYIQAKKL